MGELGIGNVGEIASGSCPSFEQTQRAIPSSRFGLELLRKHELGESIKKQIKLTFKSLKFFRVYQL